MLLSFFYRETEVQTQVCWHLSQHLNLHLRIPRGMPKITEEMKCVYFGQDFDIFFLMIAFKEVMKFPANMCL